MDTLETFVFITIIIIAMVKRYRKIIKYVKGVK